MAEKESAKELKHTRKLQGICIKCGKFPATATSTDCTSCRNKRLEYNQRNAQHIKIRKKAYTQNNAQSIKDHRKIYLQQNTLRTKSCSKKYWQENRLQIQIRSRKRRQATKLKVLIYYGAGQAKCCLCSEKRLGALTVDHIYGSGQQHRIDLSGPKGSGSDLYRWLLHRNLPNGYRTLCMNCNILQYNIGRISSLSQSKDAIRLRNRSRELKQMFMGKLGNSCIICGETTLDILTVEHQNNDGADHRRKVGTGGASFYRKVLESDNFIGLECRCFSCNSVAAWQ